MAEIKINFEKKYLYLISAIFVFLVGVGIVMANWQQASHSVWHDSNDVKITIGSTDYSLQEVTGLGYVGLGAPAWWSGVGNTADPREGWLSNWGDCSGWTFKCITASHNLGTTKLLVYVQAYSSRTGLWSGIVHNFREGIEDFPDSSREGFFWQLTDNNNIRIFRAEGNTDTWSKVRIFVWKIPV